MMLLLLLLLLLLRLLLLLKMGIPHGRVVHKRCLWGGTTQQQQQETLARATPNQVSRLRTHGRTHVRWCTTKPKPRVVAKARRKCRWRWRGGEARVQYA